MSIRNAPALTGQLDSELAAIDGDDDEAFSLIDRHTTVDGTLSTARDLRVDGQVLGTLQCGGVLFIASGAEVDATVDAAAIVVSGTLSGTIVCRGRLEIRPTGAVHGAVQTGTLVILEGALYEGQLRMDAPPAPEQSASSAGEDDPLRAGSAADADSDSDSAAPATDEQPNAYSFLRRFTTATNVETASGAQGERPASSNPERDGHE